MRVRLVMVVLLLLAMPVPLVAQAGDGEERDLTDALALAAAWLDAEQDFKDLPGIAVAVVRDQEVVWTAAFGHVDREAGVPMTPDTRFHIASISKTFAAVAVMTLVEQGALRLDDAVEDVVSWFTPPPRKHDNGPITIRSLLTHSSGLSREVVSPIWSDLTKTPTGRKMQTELSAVPPLYQSTTVFQYSNLAYLLLGEIVADVSGMPYEDYLREKVLDPLGLDATVASYPESAYGATHAIRYAVPNRGREYPRLGYTRSEGIASMGGLSSTVVDLAKYASWQFRLHEADATTEILRPSTLRNMHRVHFTDRDWSTTWGLGFEVAKDPDRGTLVSHGGHLPGHLSAFVMQPASKMAYIVMINTSGGSPGSYTRGLMALVAKLEGVPADAENRLPREALAEYEGRYEMAGGMGELHLGAWEGRLAMLSLPSDDPADRMSVYEHVEGDTFRRVRDDGDFGETLRFERGPDGEVRGGSYFSYEFRRVGS
ncbi:MAG: serine hydrolase [Gemmatimonadota bacterium]|nr:serine hydrolase [Gemmatimonadota bacterium]